MKNKRSKKPEGVVSPIQSDQLKWSYDKIYQFMHCKHCLDKFLHSELHQTMSPAEYMIYEAGAHPYTYEDGHTEGVIVVFCKRCHRKVWDSSHLKQRAESEY